MPWNGDIARQVSDQGTSRPSSETNENRFAMRMLTRPPRPKAAAAGSARRATALLGAAHEVDAHFPPIPETKHRSGRHGESMPGQAGLRFPPPTTPARWKLTSREHRLRQKAETPAAPLPTAAPPPPPHWPPTLARPGSPAPAAPPAGSRRRRPPQRRRRGHRRSKSWHNPAKATTAGAAGSRPPPGVRCRRFPSSAGGYTVYPSPAPGCSAGRGRRPVAPCPAPRARPALPCPPVSPRSKRRRRRAELPSPAGAGRARRVGAPTSAPQPLPLRAEHLPRAPRWVRQGERRGAAHTGAPAALAVQPPPRAPPPDPCHPPSAFRGGAPERARSGPRFPRGGARGSAEGGGGARARSPRLGAVPAPRGLRRAGSYRGASPLPPPLLWIWALPPLRTHPRRRAGNAASGGMLPAGAAAPGLAEAAVRDRGVSKAERTETLSPPQAAEHLRLLRRQNRLFFLFSPFTSSV